MSRIIVSMKIYPINESGDSNYWRDNQSKKDVSVQFADIKQEEMNLILPYMLGLGFCAVDSKTFLRRTDRCDLLELQRNLTTRFEVRLL